MNDKIRNPMINTLMEAVLALETLDESYAFFSDICTINELQAMGQRLAVAELLQKGWTYNEVGKETGASTATISRVSKCLNYGSDGYKSVLEKINKSEGE